MTGKASRVAVVGSTGLVGHQLVELLHEAGHVVVGLSRESGADVITGDGLDDALAGVDVVIDVINSPAPDDSARAFFEQASSNLAAVVRKSGVGHYVVLLIVGTDALSSGAGYMRGKLAQERAAAHSGAPWTVVRSTQFHELTESITASLIKGDQGNAPVASIQPIASNELAVILMRIAIGDALGAIHEVGGPQRMSFAEMARVVLTHQGCDLTVVDDPAATYFGLPIDDTTLVPHRDAELGTTALSTWLAQR